MADFSENVCGCCARLNAETPTRIDNPPGQSAIVYRAGIHAGFKASLLTKLSNADLPALAGLSGRESSDFTIALCDGLACTLDVLTFYQERIANENFLRTATERRSVLELARLIGYKLAPGVAASTYLAYTLQEVPSSPKLAAEPVTIPTGTKVQSVPGPGQQPQAFETVEPVEARVEWNAIPVQSTAVWRPNYRDTSLWLAGVGSGLQAGDVILILARERLSKTYSFNWDVRVLSGVEENRDKQLTRAFWKNPLTADYPDDGTGSPAIFAFVFRQRAALFGHNAPDPKLIYSKNNPPDGVLTEGSFGTDGFKWKNFRIKGAEVDLDAAYPKITPGGWFVLASNEGVAHPSGLSGSVFLYGVKSAAFPSRSEYGLSGKVTRLTPDTDSHLNLFSNGIRETLVLAQSEPLPLTARPLSYPLYGDQIRLARLESDIVPGRTLAVGGKRARIHLRAGSSAVAFADDASLYFAEGQSMRMASAPERQVGGQWRAVPPAEFGDLLYYGGLVRLRVLDRDGVTRLLIADASVLEMAPAEPYDEEVQEVAFISKLPSAVGSGEGLSNFMLTAPLRYCYDRDSTRINANVARATHGETVAEILGNGDARSSSQVFALRQSPLTFVSANTASGRKSTLELRANTLLWQETDSLYARGGNEKVYELVIDDEARSAVRFGDGVEGSRLPSGDHNIRAIYRKGLGLAGNVPAGKLTNLLSRPLGVTGVTNPEPARGGEDPESESKARVNAPLSVQTLNRVVSIRDYRDFARAFAGIAKSHALWIPAGPAKGVFLTVAGEAGAEIVANSDTYRFLLAALQSYGDPLLPLRIAGYRDARFGLRLAVKPTAEADADSVLQAVAKRLGEVFGFEARHFGQGVSVDEVAALAQADAGIEAVQVLELYLESTPVPKFSPRLFAELPTMSLTSAPLAAQLLTLDTTLLTLEVMQ